MFTRENVLNMTIEDLRNECVKLREALEPFAKAAELAEVCDSRDEGLVNEYAGLTVGDLRRAAAILAQTPEGQ
jgi:hypothetical protein